MVIRGVYGEWYCRVYFALLLSGTLNISVANNQGKVIQLQSKLVEHLPINSHPALQLQLITCSIQQLGSMISLAEVSSCQFIS